MSLSAREVLAGVLAVQRGLMRPQDLAESLAAGRSPAERLPDAWAAITDDAQRQLDDDAASTETLLPQTLASPLPAILETPTVAPVGEGDSGETRVSGDGLTPRLLPGVHAARFRRLSLHAKGGLGAVYLARDEELGRTVALKEILEHHSDHSNSRARFTFEAEVTGYLEHPGIVPIYGLGCHADGRLYYAMRFIQGESLEDAVRRFHKADAPGATPPSVLWRCAGCCGGSSMSATPSASPTPAASSTGT